MTFDRHEEMLLALLRHALNGIPLPEQLFSSCPEQEWGKCYALATDQGVLSIAWDAVRLLPAAQQPPKKLKLNWALSAEEFAGIHRNHCAVIDELSRFFAGHGIATVQLKGVGLSTYYPVPERRQSGDIDIYTFSSDRSRMSDIEAGELADRLIREKGIEVEMHSYKHSSFSYKGVPVENHKFFSNARDYAAAAEVETLLHEHLDPRPVQLPDGRTILVPSPEFNSLFVSVHALQHFTCGLSLIHLCDWVCVLKKTGQNMLAVKDGRLMSAINAMTRICREYLGTETAGKEGSEELADLILRETIRPTFRTGRIPHNYSIRIIWYKIRRFIYFSRIRSRIWDTGVLKEICRLITRKRQ